MKKFSIVKNFVYFLGISLLLILWSLYAFISNLRWSIEFTGGIKVWIVWEKNIDLSSFKKEFKNIKPAISVEKKEWNTYIEFRSLDTNVKYTNELLWKIKTYLKNNNYISSEKGIISTSFVWPTIW